MSEDDVLVAAAATGTGEQALGLFKIFATFRQTARNSDALTIAIKGVLGLKLPDGIQTKAIVRLARISEEVRSLDQPQRRKPKLAKSRDGWTPRLRERDWIILSGQIMRRDGERCHYCGDTRGPFHIDHVHPLSRGGSNLASNLVVACQFCNCSKGNRLLTEWTPPRKMDGAP